MGACHDSMPGRSSTVASTSSVSRSRPPRIGFSMRGLVCVSPSYNTSSTCEALPIMRWHLIGADSDNRATCYLQSRRTGQGKPA